MEEKQLVNTTSLVGIRKTVSVVKVMRKEVIANVKWGPVTDYDKKVSVL